MSIRFENYLLLLFHSNNDNMNNNVWEVVGTVVGADEQGNPRAEPCLVARPRTYFSRLYTGTDPETSATINTRVCVCQCRVILKLWDSRNYAKHIFLLNLGAVFVVAWWISMALQFRHSGTVNLEPFGLRISTAPCSPGKRFSWYSSIFVFRLFSITNFHYGTKEQLYILRDNSYIWYYSQSFVWDTSMRISVNIKNTKIII